MTTSAPHATLLGMLDGFTASLSTNPDAVAMTHGDETVTRAELQRRIRNATANLAANGLAPGDTIMFGIRPSIEAVVLSVASLRCGARLTFVEPSGPDVSRARIALTKPNWVMAESLFYLASSRGFFSWLARRKGLQLPRLSAIRGRHVHAGRRLPGVPLRSTSLETLQRDTTHPQPPADAASHGSVVVFTSGTTGAPKGVLHDATSISMAASMLERDFVVPADTVIYTHKLQAYLTIIEHGGRAVVAPLGWDPEVYARDLITHEATHVFMAPSHAWELANLVAERPELKPTHLRQVYLQSAPATVAVLERVHEVLGDDLQVLSIYGMTEIAPIAMVDSQEKISAGSDGDLVGAPTPGIETRIDDDGELHVRGPNRSPGYLGLEPTEWLATGDLATFDDAGRIVLLGRKKDMLLRSGFNLYPSLYEATISSIAGVGACAIIGAPDPVTADERVVLFVEQHDTTMSGEAFAQHVERALRTGATEIDVRALPDEIRVLRALPRSGRSDKIDRVTLRERAAQPRT